MNYDEDFNNYNNELAEYNYEGYDYSCDCIECVTNKYVERISSLGLVCPHCVRECLESFVEEILD